MAYMTASRRLARRIEKIKKLSLNIFSVEKELNGDNKEYFGEEESWDEGPYLTNVDDMDLDFICPISEWTTQYHAKSYNYTCNLSVGMHMSRAIDLLNHNITEDYLLNFDVLTIKYPVDNSYDSSDLVTQTTLVGKHNNFNYYMNEMLIGLFIIHVDAEILQRFPNMFSIKVENDLQAFITILDKLNFYGAYIANRIKVSYNKMSYIANNNVVTIDNISTAAWEWKDDKQMLFKCFFHRNPDSIEIHIF
jgi:hypothetical protein